MNNTDDEYMEVVNMGALRYYDALLLMFEGAI
jgi:hypothetical protein